MHSSWRKVSSADDISASFSSPPISNHCTTGWRFASPTYLLKTLPTAARISSRAIVPAPLSSPSYSSSILPVFARLESNFLDELAEERRNFDRAARAALSPGFLRGDGYALFDRGWIVRADFRAEAVFQGRDDFSACRIVFRVRGEHQKDVERQAHRVPLNLNVALLHDVEEPHLDFSREVGQLVDGEDAAVGAGQKSVVNGQF